MNDSSFEKILEMDCEGRYEIFLDMVSDERDIWIVLNDQGEFLKIFSEDDGVEYLPVWPHSDFAGTYCDNENGLEVKCISVPEFFSRWVPGLERDKLMVGVFPKLAEDVWMAEPSELKSDLQDVFSNIDF